MSAPVREQQQAAWAYASGEKGLVRQGETGVVREGLAAEALAGCAVARAEAHAADRGAAFAARACTAACHSQEQAGLPASP